MKLNDIDLNKLAVFVEVARAGGITPAASRLRLTPSAVSQSIKALERSLSVELFERDGKRFVPSLAGAELFGVVERYQSGLAEGIRRLHRDDVALQGRIRLGAFYGFSNQRLAALLAELHRLHPRVEVDVLFGSPSELDRLVSVGRLDFAINLFKSSRDLRLYEAKLTQDELWLVSSQPPPRRALGFEELRGAPFVDYYRRGPLVPAWISHHFGKRVRDVPVVMYASHSELVVELIMKGVGIGVVASSVAKPHVDAGSLFVIRGRRRQLVSPIWLKSRRGSDLDETRREFADRALSHFKQFG